MTVVHPEGDSPVKATLTVLSRLSDECKTDQIKKAEPFIFLHFDKRSNIVNDGLFRRGSVCG